MLYTKAINEITWDDIESFCQEQIKENAVLDYKEDFPSKLEKTISAMANTFGGIIIIGIEEDDGKPKLPVVGIKYAKGLSERVMNIVLSKITPPLIIDVNRIQ